MALMGVGIHQGDNAAYEAIKSAIESPLLDNMSINGAMGVLVHFHMHPDFPLIEMNEAMQVIEESADEDADIIFGTTTDATLEIDYVRITLVATGFEKELNQGGNSTNNPEFDVPKEQKAVQIQRPLLKVVGGEDFDGREEFLDVPTYMRQQKD
jgi:cell division protein FtsZ